MHPWSPCIWSIISNFLLLLLISVLDNTNLIVLIILIPYLCCYYIFHILLLLSLRVLLLVYFWQTFIIFLVSRSESRYRELIVEHILIQLFSGEFSFFTWLVLFRYGGWYWLWFCISYMWAILLIFDSLRYSWKRFHSSWVSAGHWLVFNFVSFCIIFLCILSIKMSFLMAVSLKFQVYSLMKKKAQIQANSII